MRRALPSTSFDGFSHCFRTQAHQIFLHHGSRTLGEFLIGLPPPDRLGQAHSVWQLRPYACGVRRFLKVIQSRT
jgi:hypothetical protein